MGAIGISREINFVSDCCLAKGTMAVGDEITVCHCTPWQDAHYPNPNQMMRILREREMVCPRYAEEAVNFWTKERYSKKAKTPDFTRATGLTHSRHLYSA